MANTNPIAALPLRYDFKPSNPMLSAFRAIAWLIILSKAVYLFSTFYQWRPLFFGPQTVYPFWSNRLWLLTGSGMEIFGIAAAALWLWHRRVAARVLNIWAWTSIAYLSIALVLNCWSLTLSRWGLSNLFISGAFASQIARIASSASIPILVAIFCTNRAIQSQFDWKQLGE